MAANAEQAYEKFLAAVGQPEGEGEWFQITQDQINAFADITFDRQFIHVDPEMAAQLSPWGVTIAHGFLTLRSGRSGPVQQITYIAPCLRAA